MNIQHDNPDYIKLNWFKVGWYRKFKKTEFIKSSILFDKVCYRAIYAKERYCKIFGYDEDELRPDDELW